MPRPFLLGFAAAALPILSAAAAPATPEEAARLTTTFERYVGKAAPGEPPRAIVTPQGESYAVSIDLKRALASLDAYGLGLDPYAVAMTLTPRPDGTWQVRSEGGPPLVVHFGTQSATFAAKTSAFDGSYDPKLGLFSAFRLDQSDVSDTRVSPTFVQNRHFDGVTQTETAVPAANGTASATVHTASTGVSGDGTFRSAAPAPQPSGNPAVPPPPQPGLSLAFTTPSTRTDAAVDGLDANKLLDLWAFLVAHPDRASLTASQGDLKGLLRAGLPYLQAFRQAAAIDALSVTTPIGIVTARAASFEVGASGLGGTGRLGLDVSFSDLVIPPGQLPPWSPGLVPTALDLHVSADGFHAAEAARAAVDDADLGKDVVITPEQQGQVAHVLWPGDGTVTLKPSRITTPMLDLTMDGHATFGSQPAGQVTITAKGLDKEIAALQARASTDPGAGQVLGPLALAKGLAKANPDGSLAWVIAFGNGPVKVNGAPLQ